MTTKTTKMKLPDGFKVLAKPAGKARARITEAQQSLVVQLASMPNGISVDDGRKVLLAASKSEAGKARLADPVKGRSWFSQYFVPSWITKYCGAGIAYRPGSEGKASDADARYLVFWKDDGVVDSYRDGCKAEGPAAVAAKAARVKLS